MIHKCRETCSCKESINSWLQHCICSTCWGFTSIYCARFYEKYKKTGRKIDKWKQLESNPL